MAFESRYTVFDFTFFMNRIVDELNEEIKEKEQNSTNKLIKILRVMKHMLNSIEI